jgi:RIO kinase 1
MVTIPDKILRELDQRMNRLLGGDKPDSESKKILDEVFDHNTLLAVYRLINQKIIETIDYPVSTGKEANVFHATSPEGEHLAVKVYRIGNAEFRNKGAYILGDPRFKNIAKGHRNIMFEWTRKESMNLERMHDNGIRVPEPIAYYENILVMEYIGTAERPASSLKETQLDDEMAREIRDDLENALIDIHHKAKLVHADFSEYNILILDGKPVIIDVAQSVTRDHPNAMQFLERDIQNFSRYFGRYGLREAPEVIMNRIRKGIRRDEEGSA